MGSALQFDKQSVEIFLKLPKKLCNFINFFDNRRFLDILSIFHATWLRYMGVPEIQWLCPIFKKNEQPKIKWLKLTSHQSYHHFPILSRIFPYFPMFSHIFSVAMLGISHIFLHSTSPRPLTWLGGDWGKGPAASRIHFNA